MILYPEVTQREELNFTRVLSGCGNKNTHLHFARTLRQRYV